ncbi:phage head morphogenesis protein, partial [Clostridioides difficile]|nr:phage head morphogenesis protein [Clostridioides difficile]
KRFEQLEEAQNNKSIKYYLELEKQYKLAMSNIEKDILIWYNRFTENEGISLLEAKKLLNTRELEEFKWSVEEYIKYGKENAINQKWMKELENASARVHITRLEALKLQIQQQVEVLYGNELDGIDKLMRDIYTSG